MKILCVLSFILEFILSHTPGEQSGQESRALSRWTGISEKFLRSAAHVILFTLLSILAFLSFGVYGSGVMIWAVLDEVTKISIPGRHCSIKDMLLNMAGVLLGLLLYVNL